MRVASNEDVIPKRYRKQ